MKSLKDALKNLSKEHLKTIVTDVSGIKPKLVKKKKDGNSKRISKRRVPTTKLW